MSQAQLSHCAHWPNWAQMDPGRDGANAPKWVLGPVHHPDSLEGAAHIVREPFLSDNSNPFLSNFRRISFLPLHKFPNNILFDESLYLTHNSGILDFYTFTDTTCSSNLCGNGPQCVPSPIGPMRPLAQLGNGPQCAPGPIGPMCPDGPWARALCGEFIQHLIAIGRNW